MDQAREPATSVTWRALLAYSWPYRRTLVLGGLLSVIGSLAGLAQPLAAKAIVDALAAIRPSSSRCSC